MSVGIPAVENVNYDASLPIVDREQIQTLLMTDDEEEIVAIAGELFDLFASEARQKLAAMETVCGESDIESYRKIVHFIAGSAGNLGIARFSSFLRGVENAIDAGKLNDLKACAAVIDEEFERSCRTFEAEFGL